MSDGPRSPRRVFLSHTSELRDYPESGSFIAAVESAVMRAGDAVVDMRYFAARDQPPARLCRDKLAAADVFILVVGFRYGSPVGDANDVSYTELEYATATELGLPRLVFMLDEKGTEGPTALMRDLESGPKQEAFRRKLQSAGLKVVKVTCPAELETAVSHALFELDTVPATRRVNSPLTLTDDLRASYLATMTSRYQLLDLATLSPETDDEQQQMRLEHVFVPQRVRAKPPEIELPRDLWRRLVDDGELGAAELPTEIDRDLLARARQAHMDQPVVPVLTMLGGTTRLTALLGDPGSGKSSLLRFLVLALISGPLPLAITAWEGWLPVMIELRTYADPTWATGRWADATLLDYLDYLHAQEGVGLPRDVLDAYLREDGRAVVMFDGLDELFDPALRETIARRIAGFALRYPRTRVIVTSRPVGYQRAPLDGAGFALHALQDFDRDEIAEFVNAWYQITYPATPTEAEDRVTRLLAGIDRSTSVADLAGNPMLLTILAVMGRHRELPRERHRVYQHAVDVLVQHWDVNRALRDTRVPMDYLDEDDRRALLRRIARVMQNRRDGISGNHIPGDELVNEFRDYLRGYHLVPDEAKRVALALVAQLRERNFILARFGPGLYGFVHRAFLEYCCAEEIAYRVEKTEELTADDLATNVFGARATDPAWREVLLLLVGMIDESSVARVLDHLLDLADLPAGRIGHHAGQHVLLALQCAAQARSLAGLDQQARRITPALISLLVAADQAAASDVEERSAIPDLIRDALPLLIELGPRLPDDEAFLHWFRTRKHLSEHRFFDSFAMETTFFAAAIGARRNSTRVLLAERAKTDPNEHIRWAALAAVAVGWPDEQTRAWLTDLALTDGEIRTRCNAVGALARTWPTEPTRTWLLDLKTENADPEIRLAVLEALAELWPDERTRILLTTHLADPDDRVRLATVEAMAKGWPDEHTHALLFAHAISEPDGEVRRASVRALARDRLDGKTCGLLDHLATTDSNHSVRWAAVQALVRGRPDEQTRAVHIEHAACGRWPIEREAMIALAERWPDEQTRSWLIDHACSHVICLSREEVMLAIADGWHDERTHTWLVDLAVAGGWFGLTALEVLAQRWPDERTRTLLIDYCSDPDESFRSAAMPFLAHGWPDERTRTVFIGLATSDPDENVRLAAVRALAKRWPDNQTRDLLIAHADTDTDTSVRTAALHALGQGWPDEQTHTLLLACAVTDVDPMVRCAVLQALAQGWPDEQTHVLLGNQAAFDPDADVRRTAAHALIRGWPEHDNFGRGRSNSGPDLKSNQLRN